MAKLLIVDDEIDIREFAKRFFQKRGIETLTAGGGKEALEVVRAQKPDLVLLDVTMDDISGIDVLKILRGEKNDIKVIMVTGAVEEETINEANSWGIKGYIHKPLVLEELEQVVLRELKM